MDDQASWVAELARSWLAIEDPARQAELAEYAPLLTWIRAAIPVLQATYPTEPPPAIQFRPGELARNFWRGAPGGV
jgi:hypothetical protein